MAPYQPKIYRKLLIGRPDRAGGLDLVEQMLVVANRDRRLAAKPHVPRNARHGRQRGR